MTPKWSHNLCSISLGLSTVSCAGISRTAALCCSLMHWLETALMKYWILSLSSFILLFTGQYLSEKIQTGKHANFCLKFGASTPSSYNDPMKYPVQLSSRPSQSTDFCDISFVQPGPGAWEHVQDQITHCRNLRDLGKSKVFPLFEKLRYWNERSNKFECLYQEIIELFCGGK